MTENRYICYYLREKEDSFSLMLQRLLDRHISVGIPIRFVFFGNATVNSRYKIEHGLIREELSHRFGKESPVFSYVAQKPLVDSGLLLEVHELKNFSTYEIRYKSFEGHRYITVDNSNVKCLFLGGIMSNDFSGSFATQAEKIFSTVTKIFSAENMPVYSIVRQWNYIEQITAFEGSRQHYQQFNDARTTFYNCSEWTYGYPAATGIGTVCGGIIVDIDAFRAVDDSFKIYPIDNTWQVAAHAYSQNVLLGANDSQYRDRTTPKFERAKCVEGGGFEMIYVSGTAAIRGEESLSDFGIEKQTLITTGNINYLISDENMRKQGISVSGDIYRLKCCRVYLKNAVFLKMAEEVVEKTYPGIDAVYLLADICRDELLVEIEGIANVLI